MNIFKLTAEMLGPGMVFQWGETETVTAPAGQLWRTASGCYIAPLSSGWTLLGCDPALASRADCEVYGIAPGIDAGVHGFARLRDGGAVDLRNVAGLVPGMVFRHLATGVTLETCAEYLSNARWRQMWEEFAETWHFIGLSADLARPEDVERLCCGNHQTEQILDGYVGRTATGPTNRPRWSCRSTSARASRSGPRSACRMTRKSARCGSRKGCVDAT